MIEVLTVKEYKEAAGKQEPFGKDGGQQNAENARSNPQEADGRMDLNTATAQELMTLNGIGEAKAANIIAYREANGGFSSVDEIMNVSGIGEGVYARIQDKIKVIR